MTRLVIVGDTHLHSVNPRNTDRLAALDHVIAEGLALDRLGAWIHVGDVFHAARSTVADRNAFAERAQRMADVAPLLIVFGNHDGPGELQIFSRLKARHSIIVVDQPLTLSLSLATAGRATIFALPFPTKAGLTAAGVAPGDVQAVAGDALQAIFLDAGAQLAAARARSEVTLMVGHATVAGAVSSVGQPMGVHGEITIGADDLFRCGDTPQVFGHIHKPQEVLGAHVVGSICRMDYGEVEEKRFLVLTYEPALHAAPRVTITSHPIPCPARWHVEGELSRDGFAWRATKGPGGAIDTPPARWDGAEVRVRYTFQQSEKSVLDETLVRAPFAAAARLEVEPIAVPDRALRSPEVAAARTLAEKLVAWSHVAGVATSESVLAKLARLEHGEPQQLLADLQRALAQLENGDEPVTEAA